MLGALAAPPASPPPPEPTVTSSAPTRCSTSTPPPAAGGRVPRRRRRPACGSCGMDFAVGIVFRWDGTDFSAVDRVDELAARYRIGSSASITDDAVAHRRLRRTCRRSPRPLRARAGHEATWRRHGLRRSCGAPATSATGSSATSPTSARRSSARPSDYARWASLAADGDPRRPPDARIAIGGFSRLDRGYIGDVAARPPRIRSLGRFDIANVHLRGHAAVACRLPSAARGPSTAAWASPARLWVTETGYPSRPAHQWDPAFAGGAARSGALAGARAARQLIDGGADAVFVSFRDNHEFGPRQPVRLGGRDHLAAARADGRALPSPPTGRCSRSRRAATGS